MGFSLIEQSQLLRELIQKILQYKLIQIQVLSSEDDSTKSLSNF